MYKFAELSDCIKGISQPYDYLKSISQTVYLFKDTSPKTGERYQISIVEFPTGDVILYI